MRVALFLTLLAAVAVAAQPLSQLGNTLGLNTPFQAQTGMQAPPAMGMGVGVGGVNPMLMQQQMQQQPIQMQMQQPMQMQMQQPMLSTVGAAPSGLSGMPLNNILTSIGAQPQPQPQVPQQQWQQPIVGGANWQQPIVGTAAQLPITQPWQQPQPQQLQQPIALGNVGLTSPISSFTPLTASPVGTPQFQGGVQLQPVVGSIGPVLPQDFGRPIAGNLAQPVLSEAQANSLVPIAQLQQQLNQRVQQLPQVTPVQNMQQPIMQPNVLQQPITQPNLLQQPITQPNLLQPNLLQQPNLIQPRF